MEWYASGFCWTSASMWQQATCCLCWWCPFTGWRQWTTCVQQVLQVAALDAFVRWRWRATCCLACWLHPTNRQQAACRSRWLCPFTGRRQQTTCVHHPEWLICLRLPVEHHGAWWRRHAICCLTCWLTATCRLDYLHIKGLQGVWEVRLPHTVFASWLVSGTAHPHWCCCTPSACGCMHHSSVAAPPGHVCRCIMPGCNRAHVHGCTMFAPCPSPPIVVDHLLHFLASHTTCCFS